MNRTYIGTKVVIGSPMSRVEYNLYRGWELPADENGDDTGYLVEYLDGGAANHPGHRGYISWSPSTVFENSYRETHGLTFGEAIEALKTGSKVARAGWNGKGMWLVLVPGSAVNELRDGSAYHEAGLRGAITINPHIDMKTATGGMQPGWLASQTDMLADDWQILA